MALELLEHRLHDALKVLPFGNRACDLVEQADARELLLLDFFRFFARGDVDHRAQHTNRLAFIVTDDIAAVENVGVGAVGAAEAIFVRPEVVIGVNDLAAMREDAVGIFGVQT